MAISIHSCNNNNNNNNNNPIQSKDTSDYVFYVGLYFANIYKFHTTKTTMLAHRW